MSLSIKSVDYGLDRQQRRNLYPVGIEVLAVNGLRFEKQVIEGLGKHRPDLG